MLALVRCLRSVRKEQTNTTSGQDETVSLWLVTLNQVLAKLPFSRQIEKAGNILVIGDIMNAICFVELGLFHSKCFNMNMFHQFRAAR